MAISDFRIDGNVISPQPTRVVIRHARGTRRQMVNGGWTIVPLEKGAIVEATWGVDAVETPTLAALRSARASAPEHTVAWTDDNAQAHSFDVLWETDPDFAHLPWGYEEIVIEFPERP